MPGCARFRFTVRTRPWTPGRPPGEHRAPRGTADLDRDTIAVAGRSHAAAAAAAGVWVCGAKLTPEPQPAELIRAMHSQIGTDTTSEVTAMQVAAKVGSPCRAGYRHLEPAATA